jgi:predicted nucleotidyltransferase component of viral defense system
MIPRAFITEWRAGTPWISDAQVEQDLVIERTLHAIFSDPRLAACLAFRGGTALYKVALNARVRYSEDIDLVQRKPEPVGPILDRIRDVLPFFPSTPSHSLRSHEARMVFRYHSETEPTSLMRLKMENLRSKATDQGFRSDLDGLLVPAQTYDLDAALETVQRCLLSLLL